MQTIEPQLHSLLPVDLQDALKSDPSPAILMRVFEHLRTLLGILHDYMPRQIRESPPAPGELRYEWQTGTLMFTDLAGFTPLMEAHAAHGREGAEVLLNVLNTYFFEMIEIISKSGGNLLGFTGDALLAQFPSGPNQSDTVQAVHAGLRMQRAMDRFANIETAQGSFSLGMRIGIHAGRFLSAIIGTARRMESVLLGDSVQRTKHAETAGRVGRICVTEPAYKRIWHRFTFEPSTPGYMLVVDDFTNEQLGEYDIAINNRRLAKPLLLDRSADGLWHEIEQTVKLIEPLACFLPRPVLKLQIENVAQRKIVPQFPELTVIFVNLIGLPETINYDTSGQEASVLTCFSRIFGMINAAVEAHGGVLKNILYDRTGADMLIYFGAPTSASDDPLRAAEVALTIGEIVTNTPPPNLGGLEVPIGYHIGMAHGAAFAAEVGGTRGRREFNILGDSVNTAARLMSRTAPNQILLTEALRQVIAPHFDCAPLGEIALKGKAAPTPVYALRGRSRSS